MARLLINKDLSIWGFLHKTISQSTFNIVHEFLTNTVYFHHISLVKQVSHLVKCLTCRSLRYEACDAQVMSTWQKSSNPPHAVFFLARPLYRFIRGYFIFISDRAYLYISPHQTFHFWSAAIHAWMKQYNSMQKVFTGSTV